MRQISKIFKKYFTGDPDVSKQLNDFLQENQNYTICHVDYCADAKTCHEKLFVVFNVEVIT